MEYDEKFFLDFVGRTRKVIDEYEGAYDATLIVNCLLGLLVVPRETMYERIPEGPVHDLMEVGVGLSNIKLGRGQNTVREFIRGLRNAVAHFNVRPKSEGGQVSAFVFRDRNGFNAELTLNELRFLVIWLSDMLESA